MYLQSVSKNVIIFLFLLACGIQGYTQSADEKAIKLVLRIKPGFQKEGSLAQIQSILQPASKAVEIKPFFGNSSLADNKANDRYDLSTIYLIWLKTETSQEKILKKINSLQFVKYAEPLYPIEVFDVPNDPQTNLQYYLPLIQAFDAHDISMGDTNIVIGIVDTGTDLFHEDLEGNYKYNYNDPINGKDDDSDGFTDNYRGWDFGDNDNNPQSEYNNHGTMVSGMASAVTDNGIGIASIGYLTKLLPIKVMDSEGSMESAYQGVVYAADHHCQIINCSWGGTVKSQLGADVIDYAINYRKCMVIAACGNSKIEEDYYPASYPGVVSVAATDNADLKWTGSTYSSQVDICAPGVNVRFTNQNNTYSNGWGTSFAAPLVSGAAALLKAYRPELDAIQIAEQLRVSSDIVDTLTDNQYFIHKMGYGRLNAHNALTKKYLPAVRVTDISYHTNQSEALMNGDELHVIFSVTNYLSQVSNCIIKLSTNSEYLDAVEDIVSTGFLNTYGEAGFDETPLTFTMDPSIPNNWEVEFTFEFQAQVNDGSPEGITYRDYQVFTTIVNKNYIDIEPNKITTTVTSNGSIGFSEQWNKTGKGFIYNQQENLLNAGGIILATDKDQMASALFGTLEFETLQVVDTFSVSTNVFKAQTEYQPIDLENLPIHINQQTLAYKSGLWESSIFQEYQLKNIGSYPLSPLYMAIFADWDLDDIENNRTGYEPGLHLFYTYPHADQLMYTGICLVNQNTSLPYGFDLVTGGNGGMDITTNFSDEQKWFAMLNSRAEAGNDGDSINVASQFTTGPFTLAPDDSITIVWAMIVAKSLYELKTIAQSVRNGYATSASKPLTELKIKIFPNPAIEKVTIEGLEPGKCNSVSLLNLQGEKMLEFETYQQEVEIGLKHFLPGFYLVRIVTNGQLSTEQKIVIIE